MEPDTDEQPEPRVNRFEIVLTVEAEVIKAADIAAARTADNDTAGGT